MNNIEDLKSDFINYLSNVDKTKLSMIDLKTYAEIVQIVDGIGRKEYFETMIEKMSDTFSGTNTKYQPIEMKGE